MRWTVENVGLILLFLVFASAAVAGVMQGPVEGPEPIERGFPDQSPEREGKAWSDSQRDRLAQAVVFEVNDFRERNGRFAVNRSDRLRGVATDHAEYLNNTGDTAHVGANDSTPEERVGQCFSGEVVTASRTQTTIAATAQSAVQKFIESRPHREILLEREHSVIGVGVAAEENGEKLRVVVDFCR